MAIEYFARPEDIYLTRVVDGSEVLVKEGYYLCEKIDIESREILTEDIGVDGVGNGAGKGFMTVRIRMIDIIRGTLNTQDVVTDNVNNVSIWIKT